VFVLASSLCFVLFFFFFFSSRRRHTRWPRDWSSDVALPILAQLGTLQQLAGRGKLASALAWIHDFLASGEPLVVFARHIEVQDRSEERRVGKEGQARWEEGRGGKKR